MMRSVQPNVAELRVVPPSVAAIRVWFVRDSLITGRSSAMGRWNSRDVDDGKDAYNG